MRTRTLLSAAFVVLIFVFLGLYLRDIDYSTFQALSINWPILIFTTLLFLVARYWGVFVWRVILKDLGARSLPPFNLLASIYAKAWLGRYIPGTVTWIASKVYLASQQNISKSRLTVSSLLEGAVQIAASLSLSLLLLSFDTRFAAIPGSLRLAMVAIALVSVICLYPPLLNFSMKKMYSLIRRRPAYDELRTSGRATVRSYFLYIIGNLMTGVSYYFLVVSLYPPTDPSLAFYIAGSFILAGALGMATPFLPSGIGVRDGAQLLLLSAVMPKEIALAITIFSRLWSIVVDLLFYVTAQAAKPNSKTTV